MQSSDGAVLSVIVPAYNAEASIGEQLAALRDARPAVPWEILVCDNGSTDATPDVVEQFAAELQELRLVDASARRGPAAARNVGARTASGRYLAFCDADDVVDKDWATAMVRNLGTHPVVAGRIDGARLARTTPWSVSWSMQSDAPIRLPELPHLTGLAAGNFGIHADAFHAVGGFCEQLRTAEDLDLAFRLQLAGYPVHFGADAVLHLRRRNGLRAVARQGYSYGTGARALRHRYADQIAAARPSPSEDGLPAAPEMPGAARHHRLDELGTRLAAQLRRLPRAARRSVLTDRVFRVAWLAGRRWGSVDPGLARIPVADGTT